MAQKRRRRSKKSSQNALFVYAILALLVFAAISAVVAALARAWPYLAGIVGAAVVIDVGVYAWARFGGTEAVFELRVTRKLFSTVLYPFKKGWRWVRAAAGFPYVEPIRAESIGELLMLTATEFEEAIAQSLGDLGYRNVRRRGGPGDLGVDITCVDPNGERLAIQCKRYAPGNLVGSREMQLFIGMIHTEHDVDRGVYVTTSGFTSPARDLGERHGIRLVGGYELARTFGFEGPPHPSRFERERIVMVDEQTAARATDQSVFCAMTEEELVAFEEMVRDLGVALPVEVVRPLDENGRRGIVFSSTSAMAQAAGLLEAATDKADAVEAQGLTAQATTGRPRSYHRRAQNSVIIDMLQNGGVRSYELPKPPAL